MINLLPLEEGERVTSILPVSEYSDDRYILMATAFGTVKKTLLSAYSRQRSVGLRAVELDEGDHLIGTAITEGDSEVMLFADSGKAIRFSAADVRATGRVSRGVRGIRIKQDQRVISLIVPDVDGKVLVVSENGYGKQTLISDFSLQGRGGQGVIAMQTSARNGPLVGARLMSSGDQVMLISNGGTVVRLAADEISTLGRNTQGVRVIRLKTDEKLIAAERIAEADIGETYDDEAVDGSVTQSSAASESVVAPEGESELGESGSDE